MRGEKAMTFGPPLEKRYDEAKATHLIEAAGFSVESVKDSGPYHYLIIAIPGTSSIFRF